MAKKEMVLTSEQRDVLKAYKQEAFEHLADEEGAKAGFKDVVEAAADKTKLPKALVAKLYKAKYTEKLADIIQQAAELEFLDGVTEDA